MTGRGEGAVTAITTKTKDESILSVVKAELAEYKDGMNKVKQEVLDEQRSTWRGGRVLSALLFLLAFVGAILAKINTDHLLNREVSIHVFCVVISIVLYFVIEALFFTPAWERTLQKHEAELSVVDDVVAQIASSRHFVTHQDYMMYLVVIEFNYTSDCCNEEGRSSFVKNFVGGNGTLAEELHGLHEKNNNNNKESDDTCLEVKLLPQHPVSSIIPTVWLERKLRHFRQTDRHLTQSIILIGTLCYFLSACFSPFVVPPSSLVPTTESPILVAKSLGLAFVGVLMMVPSLHSWCEYEYMLRHKLLERDGDLIHVVSRWEAICLAWEWLGPTLHRKAALVVYPIGLYYLIHASNGGVFGCLSGFSGMHVLMRLHVWGQTGKTRKHPWRALGMLVLCIMLLYNFCTSSIRNGMEMNAKKKSYQRDQEAKLESDDNDDEAKLIQDIMHDCVMGLSALIPQLYVFEERYERQTTSTVNVVGNATIAIDSDEVQVEGVARQ